MSNTLTKKYHYITHNGQYISNLKCFLENYNFSNELSKFSSDFMSDSKLFSEKSLIPETYIKTREPFDRNLAFVSKKCLNLIDENGKKPILFPIEPINLSNDCQLQKILNLTNKNFPSKKIIQNQILSKIWLIEVKNKNKIYSYGPYSSKKIYSFISDSYNHMTKKDKKKKQIIVLDIEEDVYYQPDLLEQILKEEFEKVEKCFINS